MAGGGRRVWARRRLPGRFGLRALRRAREGAENARGHLQAAAEPGQLLVTAVWPVDCNGGREGHLRLRSVISIRDQRTIMVVMSTQAGGSVLRFAQREEPA